VDDLRNNIYNSNSATCGLATAPGQKLTVAGSAVLDSASPIRIGLVMLELYNWMSRPELLVRETPQILYVWGWKREQMRILSNGNVGIGRRHPE